MSTARIKAKRNKIRELQARINELDRARSYIGNTKFYWGRRKDLQDELESIGHSIMKDEGIPMRTEEEFVQYLCIHD